MTTQNLSLFKALGSKMDYLNQRQRVISQNVANSDTPGYQPKDLAPVDFGSVLKGITGKSSVRPVTLQSTNASHVSNAPDSGAARSQKQKDTYEVAPAGNAVIMEEQLLNAGETAEDYTLMANLYQKHIGMLRISLGVQ